MSKMTETVPNPGPLKVENSLDLIIVLLYAPGSTGKLAEPIAGITRLQKLVFLLKQGEGPEAVVESAREFNYKPFKMGPFSQELYRDLDVLKSLGLVRTRRLEYLITDDDDPEAADEGEPQPRMVESTLFELSERGINAGRDLMDGLKRRDRDGLIEFKKFFNAISLRQLLIFVYQKYPTYSALGTSGNQGREKTHTCEELDRLVPRA